MQNLLFHFHYIFGIDWLDCESISTVSKIDIRSNCREDHTTHSTVLGFVLGSGLQDKTVRVFERIREKRD